MIGKERMTAEIAWMRRRGIAAAPERHPLRTPECPPLGALARERLTDAQRRHVASCRHCRSVREAAAQPRVSAAAALGGIAAALVIGLSWSSWRQPAPERFAAPEVQVAEPAPRAIEADWPEPLNLRSPGVRLPAPRTVPALPQIRPLERFHPPERGAAPVPVAALGGPSPPALEPAPPPDVVGMLGLRVL